jgi:hypothetical protein
VGQDVKKKKRVEIEIERREISLFVGAAGDGKLPQAAGAPDRGQMVARPAACPVCGSANLLPLAEAAGLEEMRNGALQAGVNSGLLHVHRSSSGEWWLCRRLDGF